jgi:hypothetical protein
MQHWGYSNSKGTNSGAVKRIEFHRGKITKNKINYR